MAITPDVEANLLGICSGIIPSIEETLDYSLLALNDENTVLTIPAIETHAGLLTQAVGQETQDRKITELNDMLNSKFYLIKITNGDQVLYAVRRTDQNWLSKKAFDKNHLFFRDQRLTLETDPHFEIYRSVDFFILDDTVFCLSKKNFETILDYKQAHENDFAGLQAEPEFAGVFSNMQPLIDYIGTHKGRLRRASAIKQKGHYKDADFMERVRDRHADYKLNIQFDDDGKIVSTDATAPDIMKALLDHRLMSGFSEGIFDVQSTTEV